MPQPLNTALTAALVRTACATARARALREEVRIDVWMSMTADAPALGDPGQPATWVRNEAEGQPTDQYDQPDTTAFILCWYDAGGDIHKEQGKFTWYHDITGTVEEDHGLMFMCGRCGTACVEGQLVELALTPPRSLKTAPTQCESCGRPTVMPGL